MPNNEILNTLTPNPFRVKLVKAQNRFEKIRSQKESFEKNAMPGTAVTGSAGVSARRIRLLSKNIEKRIELAKNYLAAQQEVNYLQNMVELFAAGKINERGRSLTEKKCLKRRPASQIKLSPAERLFVGFFAGGISFADTSKEVAGDYKKIAFLPYGTLELSVHSPHSDLLPLVLEKAHSFQNRKGETLQISTTGQTVKLGWRMVS
ncbi:MAG TPA: hypothetical protein PKY82_35870 [Pyrinomonadaceae bacterium]|nr:hypothetical protein [Pyrinomonadaceae bacterium]